MGECQKNGNSSSVVQKSSTLKEVSNIFLSAVVATKSPHSQSDATE